MVVAVLFGLDLLGGIEVNHVRCKFACGFLRFFSPRRSQVYPVRTHQDPKPVTPPAKFRPCMDLT